MFTPRAPLNRVHPVKFTPVIAKFTPLNPQRLFNWGVFHWGTLRVFNRGGIPGLFHRGSMLHAPCAMLAIPLGLGHSLKRYPIKLHQHSVSGASLCLFCRMPIAVKQEKQNMSQTKIYPARPVGRNYRTGVECLPDRVLQWHAGEAYSTGI